MLSDRELLLEIHQMLCRICSYIDKVESEDYKNMEDQRSFNVNVTADMYVDKLNELRNDILDRKY